MAQHAGGQCEYPAFSAHGDGTDELAAACGTWRISASRRKLATADLHPAALPIQPDDQYHDTLRADCSDWPRGRRLDCGTGKYITADAGRRRQEASSYHGRARCVG